MVYFILQISSLPILWINNRHYIFFKEIKKITNSCIKLLQLFNFFGVALHYHDHQELNHSAALQLIKTPMIPPYNILRPASK